jgi:beta-phosphoglucomutase
MAELSFRGVVLDLDGVVADSEPLHIRAWIEVLGGLGVSQDAVGETTIRGWTGVPDVDIVDGLVRQHRLRLTSQQLLGRKRRAFRELIPQALASFAGVAEELRRWDGTPLGLATATARREVELMLNTLGLRQVFRVVVTGDDVARPKPDPDCYLLAARRLGLAPADCAAVEDTPHGIRSARSAGLHALAVSTSFPPDALAEAERLFTTALEALAWVAKRTRQDGR